MRGLFYQSVDDATEGEQALVDHASLSGTFVLRTRPTNVFGSSEVHEVEFADLEEIVTKGRCLFRVHSDGEN